MADAAYRDVIIRIKVEADSSIEKTLTGIGGYADNAIKKIEQSFTAALSRIEAMMKRLETSANGLGGGGGGGIFPGGGGGGAPIGVGSGNATYGYNRREAMLLGGGFNPQLPFSNPIMQAGASAANSLGMGQAFSAYQSQLAAAISQAQAAQNVSRFHTGTPYPASMYSPAHFANLATQFPDEFFGTPRNSLPNVAGRPSAAPYNRMSGLGGYAAGPGPTVAPRRAAGGGLGFDRDRLIGIGVGLASGNWDSVASSVGTIGGTLIGGAVGAGPWGAAIGGAVGGMAGTLAGQAPEFFQITPEDESLSAWQRWSFASGERNSNTGGYRAIEDIEAGFAMNRRLRGERSFRQNKLTLAELDRATNERIGEFRGNANIQRAMMGSDGTAKGELATLRGSMGMAENDEQRLGLRQRELELVRQIAQEQTRGARAALDGLEREKDAMLDMLGQRKRAAATAGAEFGYASRGDQEAAVRAAEKYASGQGKSVTRREREAFDSFAGSFQTEHGLDSRNEEGRRRGGSLLERFEKALGVQREQGEMRGQLKSVFDQMGATRQELVDKEKFKKDAESALKPVIDDLYKILIEAAVKKFGDQNEKARAEVNSPQASAAGRSRRGLSIA